MGEPLDNEGWPCNPRRIDDEAWFYEEKPGIAVCVEFRLDGVYHGTRTIIIPWKKLEAAVKRHRRLLWFPKKKVVDKRKRK